MTHSPHQRWYDQDPALRQAMTTLRQATDKYQAQIALNIILVIVEHQIETNTLTSVDELLKTLMDTKAQGQGHYRRWYDLNETLRSAIQLLHDCPEEVQRHIIPQISDMVEDTLSQKFA